MAKIMSRMIKRDERGMALMMALFALLLLSGIGLCMVLASTTETRIDANYGGSLRSYYAAHSGLEEVRDRISYPSTTSSTGLADSLPKDIAGNPSGVVYVLNPDGGETVDPTDPTSPYFDVQLCHDYNSGVTIRDSRCTAVPTSPNNWIALQNAAPLASPTSVPLGYKWVRINMKTNRIAAPYFVDQTGDPTTLDTRVCWDGKTEQLSPGGANAPCDANGMLPVYMLTSLAMTQGTRNLARAEVVGASIRPPGAITMEVANSTNATPVLATFSTASSAAPIPTTNIDGWPRDINGLPSSACSPVAPLASNTPKGTASLQAGLNGLRLAIVQAANKVCKADGSPVSAGAPCPPPLAWVASQQLSTAISSSSPTPTPTPAPTPSPVPIATPTPFSSGSNSGSNSGPGGGDDDHPRPTPTPTPIPTPTRDANACTLSNTGNFPGLQKPGSLITGSSVLRLSFWGIPGTLAIRRPTNLSLRILWRTRTRLSLTMSKPPARHLAQTTSRLHQQVWPQPMGP